MSLRIRQVKPSFWSDSVLADWTEELRLFYIGLWMESDDAGWLRWDVPAIAADLYVYLDRRKREPKVDRCGKALMQAGRMVLHACGHAFLPHLADHQRFAGETKKVLTFEKEHQVKCLGKETAPPPDAERGSRPAATPERGGTPQRFADIIGPFSQVISAKTHD